MTYACHLEIPAREDAMLQVELEGVGRMYPSVEGANPSIRHELLGPEKAHHDAAAGISRWILLEVFFCVLVTFVFPSCFWLFVCHSDVIFWLSRRPH